MSIFSKSARSAAEENNQTYSHCPVLSDHLSWGNPTEIVQEPFYSAKVFLASSDQFSSVLVRGGTITDFREAFGVKIRNPEPS